MSTTLQIHNDSMTEWHVLRDQAAILVKTGFLPQSIKTPEQALAIILMSRELGIGIMQGFNTINVIAGKPTIGPQLMLALINRTGELFDISITDDGQACTVTMLRRGRSSHTEVFSMADAARLKTTEYIGNEKKTISLSDKYNWRQQPTVMRKWRAIAACARVVFPDVILGMYTPDEMGAAVEPESGEILETIQEKSHVEPSHSIEFPQDLPPEPIVTVDSAIGGDYDRIGALLEIAGLEDSSSARRDIHQMLTTGDFTRAAKRLSQTERSIVETFGHLYKSGKARPTKSTAFERRHSPETARGFDAVVKRLTIHGVDGSELLRETNCALHDAGLPQVKTRYELDEESAQLVIGMFEKWADVLDRNASK